MNEPEDFFDEIIGEEEAYDETDESEDDEDDEDDGEPFEVRTAVMQKNDLLALLSLKISAGGGRIVRVDPRQRVPSAQTYEDAEAATHWFNRSLATSRRNGWNVVYDGEPSFG
ncbi:MAG: hypothetical protein QOG00_299 [Pyrinomonadaceae bacterium]|jgi:hypothetical protein|nr:hypothetical protein [Pyrinomonadaceae bacterium]MDQ1610368.1 hypothetical protein [Pyrinomonadaceae bacterium]MDX6272375.1 hypothetical protein [Acidobacteriota bacterium]